MKKYTETNIYLHREKEENYGIANEMNMSHAALENFRYMGSEVTVTVWIDKDTGEAWATHLNGMPLTAKVSI